MDTATIAASTQSTHPGIDQDWLIVGEASALSNILNQSNIQLSPRSSLIDGGKNEGMHLNSVRIYIQTSVFHTHVIRKLTFDWKDEQRIAFREDVNIVSD